MILTVFLRSVVACILFFLTSIAADASGAPQRRIPFPEPVSIVQIRDNIFAFADYSSVYIWRRGDPEPILPRINITERVTDVQRLTDVWHPTGLSYSNGHLYVANYIYHNVLVFDISEDCLTLQLIQEIKDPGLMSPEGVSASGDRVAVADYDASSISMFDLSGNILWKADNIPLAHGVLIANGSVFVTGLGNRKLLKLDIQSGAVLKENNDTGWSDLLYPLTVIEVHANPYGADLAVMDANRGAIVLFDSDLHKVGSIGSNSPGMLKRPYGVVETAEGFIVADTMDYRLVEVNWTGSVHPVLRLAAVDNVGVPPQWNNQYVYCSHNRVDSAALGIQGELFTGFTTLCSFENGSIASEILLPDFGGLHGGLRNRPAPNFSFAWAHTLDVDNLSYTVIGSFSNEYFLVAVGGRYTIVTGDRGVSVWGGDGAEPYLRWIVEAGTRRFKDEDELAARCSPLFAFVASGGGFLEQPMVTALSGVPELARTKEAVAAWLSGKEVQVRDIDIPGRSLSSMDDMRLVELLSKTKLDLEQEVWDRCHTGRER